MFDEATIKSVAESLISSGLAQAGYKIVWLDFGWASGARDGNGNLIVDSTQWPDGMSGLTSWLHAQGLYAGIYTDAGTSGCGGQGVGSYGHYEQDVNQFAAWGFDAVKVDFCGAGQRWLAQPPNDPRTLYGQFSQAVAAAPRAMILNVCDFWTPGQINGTAPSYADSSWDAFSWAPAVAQSWRTDTDIGYKGNIQFQWVLRNLDQDSTPFPNIQNAAGRAPDRDNPDRSSDPIRSQKTHIADDRPPTRPSARKRFGDHPVLQPDPAVSLVADRSPSDHFPGCLGANPRHRNVATRQSPRRACLRHARARRPATFPASEHPPVPMKRRGIDERPSASPFMLSVRLCCAGQRRRMFLLLSAKSVARLHNIIGDPSRDARVGELA